MKSGTVVIANPEIVFREEFDDWAVLFNPETGDGFGINPVGVFIWKNLKGELTIGELTSKLILECEDTPDDTETYVFEFIQQLVEWHCAGVKV
jgi:SynChlorMet cassette protein ScmD